jgi:hypothetical protein
MSRWFGDRNRGGQDDKKVKDYQSKLQSASSSLTSSLRVLHGNTDELAYAFKSLGKIAFIGEAIGFVVDTIRHSVRTFNALSDVGQTFQGSLGEMLKASGEAGLSLDEYAKTLTKNSSLVAVMGEKSFGALQMSVRQTLKPMGFFGMSLSEVTDAVADVAETYRQSGALFSMKESGRAAQAISDFIGEVSGLAAATGKSRQEIIKQTQQVIRDTGAAGALASRGNQQGAEALQATTATLVALTKDTGFATLLNKAVVTRSVYLLQEGRDLFSAGLGDTAEAIQRGAETINNNPELAKSIDWQIEFAKTIRDSVTASGQTLETLYAINPALAQYLASIGQMSNANLDLVKKNKEAAEKFKKENPLSTLALTFESSFHELIGKFQTGLFESLLKAFVPNLGADEEENQKAYEAAFETMKTNAYHLGQALGELAAQLGRLGPTFTLIVKILTWVGRRLEDLQDSFEHIGIGAGWSSLLAMGIGGIALGLVKGLIGRFFGFFLTGQAFGGGGGLFKGLLGGEFGGAGGGLLRTGLRGIVGKGIMGMVMTSIIDEIVKSLPDYVPGKDIISSSLQAAGLGFMIKGVWGGIIGAIAGFLVQATKDALDNLKNPETYAADSPLWQGMPEAEQKKYQNSPASRKARGDDKYNPNPYHWWNPGSWLNQKPETPPATSPTTPAGPNQPTQPTTPATPQPTPPVNTPPIPSDGTPNIDFNDSFAVQRRLVELQRMKADDEAELKKERAAGKDVAVTFDDLTRVMNEIRSINEHQARLQQQANDTLEKKSFQPIPGLD